MTKILLVEDDPLLIDIYTTKFKEVGFEVEVVDDGEKACNSIESQKPDLILLDIVLPHVDGWEILQKLQETEATRQVPVFILSNLGQKEEIEKGLHMGAAKYLIKAHYTPSEVVEEIEKYLTEHTSQQ